MNPVNLPLVMLAIIAVFFFLVPAIGAFSIRRKWRSFRSRLTSSAASPVATYRRLRTGESTTDQAAIGVFRFFGMLEAILENDTVWIRDGDVSLSAELNDVKVYLLATGVALSEPLDDEKTPVSIPWSKVGSLIEGTKVFIHGTLFTDAGRAVFRSSPGTPLFVILFDGNEHDLSRRAIWTGRQRNEYWNHLTPASLAVGSLAMIVAAYVALNVPGFGYVARAAVTFGLAPVLPLFPPGVAFFFLYRKLWRDGRVLRAERDLVMLPITTALGDHDTATLPGGEQYVSRVVSREQLDGLVASGLAIQDVTTRPRDDVQWYAFGRPADGGIAPPEDPIVPGVVIPGEPRRLSIDCARRARSYEIFALLVFFAGLVTNMAFVFFLLGYVVP